MLLKESIDMENLYPNMDFLHEEEQPNGMTRFRKSTLARSPKGTSHQ